MYRETSIPTIEDLLQLEHRTDHNSLKLNIYFILQQEDCHQFIKKLYLCMIFMLFIFVNLIKVLFKKNHPSLKPRTSQDFKTIQTK